MSERSRTLSTSPGLKPRANVADGDGEGARDVVVIGAGPAGTSAALYASRAGLDVLVLDRGAGTGALEKASRVANYPGLIDEPSGQALIGAMRRHAAKFGASFSYERVIGVELDAAPKVVWGAKEAHRARSVIIATGSMGRAKTLPGEERLVGRGVSYCATCDAAFFGGKEVAVVGSSDEALEEALFLATFALRVYLLSPTEALVGSRELEKQATDNTVIELHLETRVAEVLGDDRVEAVRVDGSGPAEAVIPVDGVFIYLQGREPVTDFLRGQLTTDDAGCLIVDEAMQTSVPGVFGVGDVLCKHLKQAVVAAGEGAVAASAARRYLTGAPALVPDWA